jgi:hypothetical protein
MTQQSELSESSQSSQTVQTVPVVETTQPVQAVETFPSEDYLDEDKPLRHNVKRQNWCVISMLTPNSFPVSKRSQFKDQKILGIKFRGVYDEYSEATARAEQLQKNDKYHNVFVGEIGKWLPFDVDASNMGSEDQVYREKSLNKYMKSYKEALHEEEVEEKERKENMLKDATVVTEKPEELLGSSKLNLKPKEPVVEEELIVVKPQEPVQKELSLEEIEKLSKTVYGESNQGVCSEQTKKECEQPTVKTSEMTDLEKELEKQENDKVKLQEELEKTKKSLEGLEGKLSTINELYAKLKSS